jgi:hypothetical protein
MCEIAEKLESMTMRVVKVCTEAGQILHCVQNDSG